MPYLNLIIKNILRNKKRTFFTISGVFIALCLFSVMMAINDGFNYMINHSTDNSVITVREKARACIIMSRIPEGYLSFIKRIPQIEETSIVVTGMVYDKRIENVVFIKGIEPESYIKIKKFMVSPNEGYERFIKERGSGLLGIAVAKMLGVSVGDRLVIGDGSLNFVIHGIIHAPRSDIEANIVLHKEYLQKVMMTEGKAAYMMLKVKDVKNIPQITHLIDDNFANAEVPTTSQSERGYMEAFWSDFVEIREFILLMAYITIGIVIIGTTNSVAMSVRERTREIGILKAIGFGNPLIFMIIMGESIVLTAIGGICSIVFVKIIFGIIPIPFPLFTLTISKGVAVTSIMISVMIGIIGCLLPAFSILRLKIVEALRIID